MTLFDSARFQRRQVLQTVSGLAAGAFGAMLGRADDLPKNTNPRAIFGDSVEPDWEQRVTITVGPKKADLVGATDRVIQAAVDYVARKGGGTVRVLPGTYRLRKPVFLQSKVRLLGSGTDSVLFQEPSVTTKLIVDGDHWDQEVTLADAKGFQVGDGARLVSKDSYGKGLLLFVYDPATNTLEDRGVIVPGMGGEGRPVAVGPDGRIYGTGSVKGG